MNRPYIVPSAEEQLLSLQQPRRPVTYEEALKSVEYGLSLGERTHAYVREEEKSSDADDTTKSVGKDEETSVGNEGE